MKIYYFAIASTVLMILFFLAGFNFTVSSWIFTQSGLFSVTNSTLDLKADTNVISDASLPASERPSTPPTGSSFFRILALMVMVGGIVSAVAGLFVSINFTFAIKSAFVMPPLILLIMDWFTILNQAFTTGAFAWVYWLMFIIIAPLIFGYVIAISEYWEGRD